MQVCAKNSMALYIAGHTQFSFNLKVTVPVHRVSIAFSLAALAVGVIGIIGWFAGIPMLTAWGPGLVPIAPLTAIALVAMGVAIAFSVVFPDDAFGNRWLTLTASTTLLLGIYGLAEMWMGGLLTEFITDRLEPLDPQFHGIISPVAAIVWILLAGGFLTVRRQPKISTVLLNIAGIVCTIVLLGYLYRTPLLYGSGLRPMPLPAATAMLWLAIAGLCLLGPEHVPLRFVTGASARSRLLRAFLPVLVAVIIVDGILSRYMPRDAAPTLRTAISVLVFVGTNLVIIFLATRLSGAAIDQAEQRRMSAEKTAADRLAMFEQIFESAPGAMVAVDERGHIMRVNGEAERKFGYRREEMIGQPIEMLVPDRVAARHRQHTRTYLQAPRVRPMGVGLELYAKRKDGTEFPVDIMLGPLHTEHGTLILSIVYDISDRKRAEQEIQTLNQELQKRIEELEVVNKELESFSYSVSHDLRAPLRAIYGFTQVIAEDYGAKFDEEGRRVLHIIQENTKRMGQLIDDLLAFSRLGRQGITTHPTDLSEIVKSIFEEVARQYPDRVFDFRLHLLPLTECDRSMIRQVLVNLIANAAKFTKDRSPALIEVGAMLGAAEHTFFVRDNGVGFDMRYAHKLFGVFQRLHRQQDFEGTGVGLAIVQRIIHRHGGRVWAESQPDKGATFFFTLPTATIAYNNPNEPNHGLEPS